MIALTRYKVFLSYARANEKNTANERNTGNITKLKRLIEEQVNEVTGKQITIFKDDESLEIGSQWNEEINKTIAEDALLLIALITPSFFQSSHCRDEVKRFLEKEKRLGRNDLILPIYLVDVDEINDEAKGKTSWLASTLLQRNLLDFRALYDRNFPRVRCRNEIRKLSLKIKKVFEVFDEISSARSKPEAKINLSLNRTHSSEESEYHERMSHLLKEKEFLADRFGEFLWARLNHLNQPTVLLIDSGTTLFHFFCKLGALAVDASTRRDTWIKNLMVVTNNLTGVRWLMRYGKESRYKWADPALPCIMLPGTPLAAYSATTSLPETSQFYSELERLQPHLILENLKATRNCRVIALVSGSWIRIRNSFPRYPIPLARGRGHLDIKQTMINLADEVYVVATLGRIFADITKSEVKATLYGFVNAQRNGGDVYQEVNFDAGPIRQIETDQNESTNKIRLVTTSRTDGKVLSRLSQLLEKESFLDTLNVTDENFEEFKKPFFLSEFNDVSNLMFAFDKVPASISEQVKEEFPREECWKSRAFLRSFHLSDEILEEFFRKESLGVG